VSKTSRSISALGAVFFAAVGLAACGGGVPGDAVVKVGETPITNSTFKHWLGVAAVSTSAGTGGKAVLPEPPNYTACIAHLKATEPKPAKGAQPLSASALKAQCATQYKSYLQEVLSFLISSQWVLGEAQSMGVKVSDAEVKKQFLKIKNAQFPKASEFEKFLASSGQTVSDLLLRVKLNLLSTKIQQKIAKKKANVTTAEIEKYYNQNKSRFGTPEKRNVAIILTKNEAAAKSALQEIRSGKSFASVAKAVSTDPTSRQNGGMINEVVKGEEDKALDQAIFSTTAGKLSGPVKSAFGYYVYEVKKITPGNEQSLSAVKSQIKAQLAATQQQEALSKFVKSFRKKWTEKTECRSEYVVPDCKQYKAPKTSTSTTPGK
jgi:parvulin-like peptidyl-prolyl isomerase